MEYLIAFLVISGVIFLISKYLDFRKAVGKSEGFAQRRAVSLLFLGFTSLIGITSVLADFLFKFFQLNKPAQFEWQAFGAYVVFAVATVLIMRNKNEEGKKPHSTITQTHSESGDNVGRDKHVTHNYHYPEKKKQLKN